ncbi:MAG TPA: class I fructose-bisphosphate aldolase [Myxococcota bacterium]|nr:class I fructose-bisphosphate aldolase [Myxococcota bacterium]
MSELEDVARAMVAPHKGILAADESGPTIKKRFDSIKVESTEESRRAYRELLFTTPGVEEFVSGVILYDETIRQKAADGTPFPKLLERLGILPGIKVDAGAKNLAGAPGEKITEGLDKLRERLVEYRGLGARFAKWRAVIEIGAGIPSDYCLDANAHALARYAALCIEGGIVPIVEPEVLLDGPHPIERCYEVTERTLRRLFAELYAQRVPLEQTILKPNMVLSGTECPRQAGVREVAEQTLRCFRHSVPAAIPGIVFLSGGQSDEDATAHLNEMNRQGGGPWELSFSYGRALQAAPLKAWAGRAENRGKAQAAFLHRARCNGAARSGSYTAAMEKAA